MLIKQNMLERIVSGEVSLAFRRWQKPTIRAGGRLRTALGELAIESVEQIPLRQITADDAERAGYPDLATLKKELATRTGDLYRIALRYEQADTRIALRERGEITPAELTELHERLAKLDARSKFGPWTRRALERLRTHPEERAADLASALWVEKEWLKTNIRKLKELGLTESLLPGYRLSPRGERFLELW